MRSEGGDDEALTRPLADDEPVELQPDLGKVSAAALLTEMPELGSLGRKQAASLADLAPVTRESGQWRGTAFIRGRRKSLRDALSMPAVVAMRFNPDLKREYDSLCSAGKPAKVAIIALMRRLIELANTLVKTHRMWRRKGARSRRIL